MRQHDCNEYVTWVVELDMQTTWKSISQLMLMCIVKCIVTIRTWKHIYLKPCTELHSVGKKRWQIMIFLSENIHFCSPIWVLFFFPSPKSWLILPHIFTQICAHKKLTHLPIQFTFYLCLTSTEVFVEWTRPFFQFVDKNMLYSYYKRESVMCERHFCHKLSTNKVTEKKRAIVSIDNGKLHIHSYGNMS